MIAARLASYLALAATAAAPILFFADAIPLASCKLILAISTIAWFATAPFWMKE